MTYSYTCLWEMLIDKGMKKTELKDKAGFSINIVAEMGKEPVSMETRT